jgi:hypothetical protein
MKVSLFGKYTQILFFILFWFFFEIILTSAVGSFPVDFL